MDLLERDAGLHDLVAALDDARRGAGRVALVCGEAGIGKTALVGRFTHLHCAAVPVHWGGLRRAPHPAPARPAA